MGIHNVEAYSDIKMLLEIPNDEPIFILRAQDDASPGTLVDYLTNVKDAGASDKFKSEIADIAMEFASWRSNNEDKCKTPD